MSRNIARRLSALESTAFAYSPPMHERWLKTLPDDDVDLLARIAKCVKGARVDFDEACTMAGLTTGEYQRLADLEDDYQAFSVANLAAVR